jgi:hypothetical protein
MVLREHFFPAAMWLRHQMNKTSEEGRGDDEWREIITAGMITASARKEPRRNGAMKESTCFCSNASEGGICRMSVRS